MVQIKASDNVKYSEKNKGFEISLEKRDLELWLNEHAPVIVILYDAKSDDGYFINLKSYFSENRIILQNIHKTKPVFLPKEKIFNKIVAEALRVLTNEKL